MSSFACINSPMHLVSAILKPTPLHLLKINLQPWILAKQTTLIATQIVLTSIEIGKIGILYILLAKALDQKGRETSNNYFFQNYHPCGYRENNTEAGHKVWKFD